MKNKIKILNNKLIISYLTLLFLSIGCQEQKNIDKITEIKFRKPAVSDGGEKIIFPEGAPGLIQIKTQPVTRGEATISVIAPAHVVANISSALTGGDKIILFESPDITSLFSQYRQAQINVTKATHNLDRSKDMYESHTATAKDVSDAETDLANSKTVLAETEAKLRTMGYNPTELENSPIHYSWLISDVAESQLKDVQKGEQVRIVFSSFPDKTFLGRVESIGDVIDPVTRTVKVRVILQNINNQIIPGMFAKVDFGDPVKNVFILPLGSIITVDGKDYTFVQNSLGSFERRRITVSNSVSKEAIVLSGLSDGESVVTEGAMLLKGLSFGF